MNEYKILLMNVLVDHIKLFKHPSMKTSYPECIERLDWIENNTIGTKIIRMDGEYRVNHKYYAIFKSEINLFWYLLIYDKPYVEYWLG